MLVTQQKHLPFIDLKVLVACIFRVVHFIDIMDFSGQNIGSVGPAAAAAACMGLGTINMGIGAQAAAPGQNLPILRTHQARTGRRIPGNGSGYPWPYSLQAQTPPDFYGSGARSSSRRRRDASREARRQNQAQTDSPPVRGTPPGPVERTEWTDALDDLKLRVHTLERLQRDQAAHIAANKDEVSQYNDEQ